jgi:3-methyladenine DNA glycosylase/8-oxoguanine DNA glycosylase
VTIELTELAAGRVRARAWGPGATWALDRAAAWLGSADRPETFKPASERVVSLSRAVPGLRLGRSPFPYDLHASFVLQQRVTHAEAAASHHAIARRFGEEAPGPYGTVIFPGYDRLRRVPAYEFMRLGVEQKRAGALLEAARLADRVLAAAERGLDEVRRYLYAIPGTGPWTAEHMMGFAFGDPDAVPTGDVHLPHDVSFTLTGEPWASDERMLELLEPFRGHRFRVIRLVALAGPTRPYIDRSPTSGAGRQRRRSPPRS